MNENTGVPVRAIWRRVLPAVDQCREGEIYQISLMSALIDGVYEGRPPLPSCSSTVISALVPSIIWTAN